LKGFQKDVQSTNQLDNSESTQIRGHVDKNKRGPFEIKILGERMRRTLENFFIND